MARPADVIVVGLGAVGSAAVWRLAEAGHRVVAFDRWAPPHALGSTHGESRITRVSAWEGARYVPLVRRANTLWEELERLAGETLFVRNGALFIARPGDSIVAGSRASAEAHAVPFEWLDAADLHRRWPHIQPPEGTVGFLDVGGGVLLPEPILRAEQARATSLGAELHPDEPVRGWATTARGVRVTTARGAYEADRLVLCSGAWMVPELSALGTALRTERVTMHWFDAEPGAPPLRTDGAPVVLVADAAGHATAVFPAIGNPATMKVATHGSREFVDPGTVDRAVHARDIEPAHAAALAAMPRAVGAHQRSAVCLYTDTPDGHFIIDRHPAHESVVLASACNGFGFKFSAAVGEALACLAVGDTPPVDLGPWRLAAPSAGRA